MFQVIHKYEAKIRKVSDGKTVENFITKEISPKVSLAVVENKGNFGNVSISSDRIYYILSGSLTLESADEKVELQSGDACFVSSGSSFNFSGDCRAVTVDQSAFGT